MGLRPAMTLKCPVALVRSLTAGRGGVLRTHLDRRARHHRGAAADRLRRRGVPGAQRPHRRADQRPAPPQRRPDLHGPVRRRPRARRRSTSPRVTRRSCSAPAAPASPPHRTGPRCSAPSTTRSSPARAAGSSAATREAAPVADDTAIAVAQSSQRRPAGGCRGSERGGHRRRGVRGQGPAQAQDPRRLRGRGLRSCSMPIAAAWSPHRTASPWWCARSDRSPPR